MTKPLIYTGIGSRQTPAHILNTMFELAQQFADHGWTLRSGHADGADNAFESGCDSHKGAKEIYLPWVGFNYAPKDDPRFMVPEFTLELRAIAMEAHPAWNRCSEAARKLHMRNVPQVLGQTLRVPSTLVICWTKDGRGEGGTGQAIRISQTYGVPHYDLGSKDGYQRLADVLGQY